MTVETAYKIFLDLPEKDWAEFYMLIDKHKQKNIPKIKLKKAQSTVITRQEAIDYLLKNVFSQKSKIVPFVPIVRSTISTNGTN
jgi:hypothetical protein